MKKALIISFVLIQVSVLVNVISNQKYAFYGIIAFFAAIQGLQITLAYVTTKRIDSYELALVNKKLPINFKKFTGSIAIQVLFLVLIVLLLKRLDKSLLFYFIPLVIASSIIQYIIVKDKKIPSYFIHGDLLFVNDLLLIKHNLKNLQSIKLNGFNDVYTAEFEGSKRVRMKQENFDGEDFKKFLAAMLKKSSHEVVLSENIAKEINATKTNLVLNNR